jgi:hypothetical protein
MKMARNSGVISENYYYYYYYYYYATYTMPALTNNALTNKCTVVFG